MWNPIGARGEKDGQSGKVTFAGLPGLAGMTGLKTTCPPRAGVGHAPGQWTWVRSSLSSAGLGPP